jgi:hypothetical protein
VAQQQLNESKDLYLGHFSGPCENSLRVVALEAKPWPPPQLNQSSVRLVVRGPSNTIRVGGSSKTRRKDNQREYANALAQAFSIH